MFLTIDNVSGTSIALQKPFPSLTDAQAASITAALDDAWSIDRIVNCDESLALLLTPPGGVEAEVAFYVDAEGGGLNLSIMHGDDLRLHGCYGSCTDALLAAIRSAC